MQVCTWVLAAGHWRSEVAVRAAVLLTPVEPELGLIECPYSPPRTNGILATCPVTLGGGEAQQRHSPFELWKEFAKPRRYPADGTAAKAHAKLGRFYSDDERQMLERNACPEASKVSVGPGSASAAHV